MSWNNCIFWIFYLVLLPTTRGDLYALAFNNNIQRICKIRRIAETFVENWISFGPKYL
jgi:hypothetical protein